MSRLNKIILLCLLATPAFPQPAPEGIVEDVAFDNGVTVTLFGSGFGSKSTAAPLLWDDLTSSAYAGLSDGDLFPTRDGSYNHPQDASAPWKTSDGSYYLNSTTYRLNASDSRVAGRAVYRADGRKGWTRDAAEQSDTGYMIIDFWYFTEGAYSLNLEGDPQDGFHKVARTWTPDDKYSYCSVYAGRVSWGDCGEDSAASRDVVDDNAWTHVRLEVTSTTSTMINCTSLMSVFNNNGNILNITDLGHNASQPDATPGPMNRLYHIGKDPDNPDWAQGTADRWGDIYFDDTKARVILGDASTISAVSHYEMQIPSSWSSTLIEFKINTGSFNGADGETPGDSAWLYVYDSNGDVNTNGIAVTINESDGGVTLPEGITAPPTELKKVGGN